jgi:hypothetical protein
MGELVRREGCEEGRHEGKDEKIIGKGIEECRRKGLR